MNSRSFFWSRARNCSSAPRAFWYVVFTIPAWPNNQIGQEKEVVITLIDEMYPCKNPKALSIDMIIIKPCNSPEMRTNKAPRKLPISHCSKIVKHQTIQQTNVIQQFLHRTFTSLVCPCPYLPAAIKNYIHRTTTAMIVWK